MARKLHGSQGPGLLGSTRRSTEDESSRGAEAESSPGEGDKRLPWAQLTAPPLRRQLVLGECFHSAHLLPTIHVFCFRRWLTGQRLG